MTHYVIRIARRAGIAALFVMAAMFGILSGVLFAFAGDLPQISALDDYAPSTITRVYAANQEVIGEFATQRRVVIRYEDIAPRLRQAVIATEDAGFDKHFGVNIYRIAIAAMTDVLRRRYAQGASTLTQQLARNLFLTPEQTAERKIKEALLSIQIEKRYTKIEIFTLYCNQIYFGHGAYGVEAASRLYFGKRAKQLELPEAALIAGVIQAPERQSPFVDLRRATARRNHVLQRMADEGYITQAEADAAKQAPIVLRGQPTQPASIAPFFVEEVRKYLERKYGAKQLYENGLAVQTALDVRLQDAANRALERGLRKIDKRHGFRKMKRNVLTEGRMLDSFRHERWDKPISIGDIVPALVTGITAGRQSVAHLRIGRYRADLAKDGFAWTRKTSAADLFKPGDLIELEIKSLDEATGTATGALEQTPVLEGAVLALDNRTGQITTMVGGYSFARSKFNRAVQALRQVGSAFKPFVYTAAIDRGYTPASTVIDTPVTYNAGPGQPPYTPKDYDGKYEGAITLRHALEQSRNVPAVRMMDQLGPNQVIAYARRFGLEGPLQPFLSTALGASEASLLDMTSAYSVFPNQGVRMRPYQILKVLDREGNLLEENRPEPHDAIRADTAFVMTNLLRGVVQRGTAATAASLNWPLAGKTGTTDDYTDAWFIGFDPDITVGVWVGLDEKKPIGHNETGAVAALPIWIEIMRSYLDARGRDNPPQFQPPGNIVFLAVDRATGSITSGDTPGAISEAFIAGTQPIADFPRQ